MTTKLSSLSIGKNFPVRVMGVINVSAESFFKGSIKKNPSSLKKAVQEMEQAGADFIDVGAMSTAPYLKTQISIEEEKKRLCSALEVISKTTKIPLSADTTRSAVAEAALNSGASIINDISGLSADDKMSDVMKKSQGIILMAHPNHLKDKKLTSPVNDTLKIFKLILKKAATAGLNKQKIVLDPGIGFFRNTALPWWKWDLEVIHGLRKFDSLKIPLLIGVSRKSFIGEILKRPNPNDRLAGSLAATTISILNGASIIRTHDVLETKDVSVLTSKVANLSS